MAPRARRLLSGALLAAFAATLTLAVAVQVVWLRASTFRDEEAIDARSARYSDREALRLLFVGDSFTAGSLSESDLGWWAYVPAALRERGVSRRVEVLSVAVAGSPTPFHRRQVRDWLDESGQVADFLVFVTGANNPNSVELWTEYVLGPTGARHTTRSERALYGAPSGFRLFALSVGRRLGRDLPPDPRRRDVPALDMYLSRHPEYHAWIEERTTAEFVGLASLARERGMRPIAASYLTDPLVPATRAGASAADVPFFDIASEARQTRWGGMGLLSPDGWHLSDAGNKRYAALWVEWFLAGPGALSVPSAAAE